MFLVIKTKSLLLFYISYEVSILPISLIVFLYGYQPEKLRASLYLLLYTVVRSLPLFLFIVYCREFSFLSTSLLTLPLTLTFIVKTPIYLLHTWLPKAHVEAPVGGSIILAGVMLKLGSYGLLIFLPRVQLNRLLSFYYSMSLLGSIICSLICLRQGDMKVLIAYSSVVHIGVVTLGFISGREVGYACGMMMVLRHGVCSPFLFLFAFCLYESSHSRLLSHNIISWPLMMSCFLSLVSLNLGVPLD